MAWLDVLSGHLPGGIEGNHLEPARMAGLRATFRRKDVLNTKQDCLPTRPVGAHETGVRFSAGVEVLHHHSVQHRFWGPPGFIKWEVRFHYPVIKRSDVKLTGFPIMPKSHSHRCTSFPRIQDPSRTSRRKKGAIKQVPHWGPRDVRPPSIHNSVPLATWRLEIVLSCLELYLHSPTRLSSCFLIFDRRGKGSVIYF